MKNIKVLGTGCASCRNVAALITEVAQQQARQRAAIADYQQAVLVAFAAYEATPPAADAT